MLPAWLQPLLQALATTAGSTAGPALPAALPLPAWEDYTTLAELHKLSIAEDSDLCAECRDPRLTTRIISGVRDAGTRKKLLAVRPFPTLEKAVDICRSDEHSKANEAALTSGPHHLNEVFKRQVARLEDESYRSQQPPQ